MSRRSYYGRHTSPYSSSPNRSPLVVNDDDYSYMTPDDIVDPPAGFWPSSRQQPDPYSGANDSVSAPDTLTVKHRNQRVTLEFPAFSIGEGFLKIGLIRQYAAEKLNVRDVRRVKLRYKNKSLRDDEMPARDAGLKQNSELLCIITEAPYDDSGSSEAEAGSSIRGPRVDVDGTIIHDREPPSQRIPKHRRDPTQTTNSNPPTPSRNNFQPANTASSSTNTRTAPTPTPTSSASDLRSSSSASYTPPPGPRTPRETLQDLTAVFNTKYRPMCQAFIDHPPSDLKARAQEHTKLSETILAQVLLKLDDVQTDGNEALRRMRKTAVHEAQAMLGQLDRVVGKARN